MLKSKPFDLRDIELTAELWDGLENLLEDIMPEGDHKGGDLPVPRKEVPIKTKNLASFSHMMALFEELNAGRAPKKLNPIFIEYAEKGGDRLARLREGNLFVDFRWNGSKYTFQAAGQTHV